MLTFYIIRYVSHLILLYKKYMYFEIKCGSMDNNAVCCVGYFVRTFRDFIFLLVRSLRMYPSIRYKEIVLIRKDGSLMN